MNIFQEISDVIGGGETAPVTAKRQAKTTVVVEDGQTVVIGGLIQDRAAESESGVPCLGNLPVVGALFRTRTKDSTKRNLLIFITPHILNTPEALAAITEEKRRESEERKLGYEEERKRDLQDSLDMILK
jgi:general secretion pathway protein D